MNYPETKTQSLQATIWSSLYQFGPKEIAIISSIKETEADTTYNCVSER